MRENIIAEPCWTLFNPGADALLNLLCPLIDDGMLQEIAEADYGDAPDKHLAPLKQFRDHRIIPALNWHPAEVLELIRWSQPEDPHWKPGSTGRRGHLLRAFACATLLRSYAYPPNADRWLSLNETAIQLAESIHILGAEFSPSAAQFFAWCIETLAPSDENWPEGGFFGIALLSFVAKDAVQPDLHVINLCKWIAMKVSVPTSEIEDHHESDSGWLRSLGAHNMRSDAWGNLGKELYTWAEQQPFSERTAWVAKVGKGVSCR